MKILSSLLISVAWMGLAAGQPVSSPLSWGFVGSHTPEFKEKGKESERLLVVEILFRNNQTMEQTIIVEKDKFQATTLEGRPVEILGLLFAVKKIEGGQIIKTEGAKRMTYKGETEQGEMLSEVPEQDSTFFIHSPGPVEIVIGGGQSYKQRFLLIKPEGGKPFRLKFNNLPELEVSLPQ